MVKEISRGDFERMSTKEVRHFCKWCKKLLTDKRTPDDSICRTYYIYFCKECDKYNFFYKKEILKDEAEN